LKESPSDRNIEILNSSPINQRAKEMLDSIGQRISPNVPYSVQLVLWAVHNEYIVIEDILLETVQAMPTWSSVRLLNFFINTEKQQQESVEILTTGNPLDLVQVILDDIEQRIMSYFPWYGSCLEM